MKFLVQVMVAEPASRRKGLAQEALIIFMLYGANELLSPFFHSTRPMRDTAPAHGALYRGCFIKQGDST